jgi:putative addiction module component (TIGR02574 family)
MSVNIEQVEINGLSVSERLALTEKIWVTLPAEVRAEDTPAWHFEMLSQRLKDLEANPDSGTPWRDVIDGLGSRP